MRLLSLREEANMFVVGIVVFLLHTLTSTDAAFTWIRSNASVDFIQGQTAKLVWTVNTGNKWVRVDIYRNKLESTVGEAHVIDIAESTGKKTKHLSARDTDIDLDVQGTNVATVTFTLHNLSKTTDELYYRVKLTASVSFLSESRYTFLKVLVLPRQAGLQLHSNKTVFCRNDIINMTCNALNGTPSETDLMFIKNNSIITTIAGSQSGNYSNAVLTKELNETGTFSWSCQAKNVDGASPPSGAVTITVTDPPEFTSCTSMTVVEKNDLVWTCDVSGSQPLNISWFKGNTSTVIQSGKSLNITTVSRADSGMYRLTASNGGECPTASKTVYLDVHFLPGTPVLQVHPDKPVFCQGDTINITCNGVTGHPKLTTLAFLQNNSSIGMLNGATSGNYTKAVLSHALTQPGTLTFSCKATNAAGSSPTSNVVTITVKDPPVITSCTNNTVVEKENLVWTCDVSGSQPLTISWFKGNTNTVIQSGKSFNIAYVRRADSGMYRFTARNGGECTTVSTTVYLDVLSKPRNVQVLPANIAALEINGSFNLTCIASSNPDSSYTWSLNGVTLDGKTNRVLTKDNITPQDAGEYTCTVTNSAGSGTSNKVTINVNYAPKMKACDSVRHLSDNTSFVINCEKPNGFPTPSYITLFNGTSYNTSITIDRVTKALNGLVIQCFASNALGSASCNTTLINEFSEYVYKGSFRITNHLYQDILDDRSFLEFKILKAYIENMLKSVYTPYKYVTSAEVIAFWPGSVIVGFQLKLIANINDPLSPIKEALKKNGSSLDGLKIDPNSVQSGEYVPPTTMRTTKATTLQQKSSQVLAIVLGVLFAIALVIIIILVGYIIWKHRIENKARPKRSSNNNREAIYMNNIALQDEVPSNVAQYESVGNQEQHQTTTQLYQSLQTQTQTDTYSSLSPNTKLPPKPAVITNSGVYQDLQGASRPQYQSLDNFSRV